MSEQHEEPAAPEYPQSPPAGSNGLAGGAEPDPSESEAPPPSWREDWRTALAGGDEKKAKQLERFARPENFAKAFFDTRERLSSTRAAVEPPEEATDAEIAAWRKQAGIPETPDGYGIAFPEGVNATERDKQELSAFSEFMHSKGIAPRAAKAAFEFYVTTRSANAEQTAQAAEEATLENLAELRKTYPGREYKRSIGLANDFLGNHFSGPDAQAQLDTILSARMPNGVALTNYAPFVQFVVAMARNAASEDDLVAGDAGGGARSVDQEFMELAAKPKLTPAERSRMEQLAAARIKREERG